MPLPRQLDRGRLPRFRPEVGRILGQMILPIVVSYWPVTWLRRSLRILSSPLDSVVHWSLRAAKSQRSVESNLICPATCYLSDSSSETRGG
jgi:hypothetical protein